MSDQSKAVMPGLFGTNYASASALDLNAEGARLGNYPHPARQIISAADQTLTVTYRHPTAGQPDISHTFAAKAGQPIIAQFSSVTAASTISVWW